MLLIELFFLSILAVVSSKNLRRSLILTNESVKQWKNDYCIRESADLSVELYSSDTITANGKEYSLTQMNPYDILSPDFIGKIDDDPDKFPKSENRMFRGKDGDAHIFLTRDPTGNVDFIKIEDEGDVVTLVPVEIESDEVSDKFIAITSDDYDIELLHDMLRTTENYDSIQTTGLIDVNAKESKMYNEKISHCDSIKAIDIAIAFDSAFCAEYGGSNKAVERVKTIAGLASLKYAEMCAVIQISYMEGYCNPETDIYKDISTKGGIGCVMGGEPGMLQDFRNYWNDKRTDVKRSTVHLFSGLKINDEGKVGCAYDKALCNKNLAYGVHLITVTKDLNVQSVLFAHELAHNAGAGHHKTGNHYIMSPAIDHAKNGFSRETMNSMRKYIRTQTCLPIKQLIHVTNAASSRRLFAEASLNLEDGFGADVGHVDNNMKHPHQIIATEKNHVWFLEETSHDEKPAYFIVNYDSGRRLYANEHNDWEDGVGAGSGTTWHANQKWFLHKTLVRESDKEAVYIENAVSGRRLFARKHFSGRKGVGAEKGTDWFTDQKWIFYEILPED